MTTRSLAPDDPARTAFDATVTERRDDPPAVGLAETYFYPEGGGQPADRGTVAGVDVTDVQSVDGRVLHRLAEPLPADEVIRSRVPSTPGSEPTAGGHTRPVTSCTAPGDGCSTSSATPGSASGRPRTTAARSASTSGRPTVWTTTTSSPWSG
jgi:hypothetical protein